MGEFFFMEDWDLQAVVSGCTNIIMDDSTPQYSSSSSPLSIEQQELLWGRTPEIFETTTVFDELGDLYKPFYPVLHPLSTQTILASSVSLPTEMKELQNGQKQQPLSTRSVIAKPSTDDIIINAAKQKRSKKNQQKRVVKQVTVEGLSSDMWAWRKYGQKPIKGSPYPRSYYRCSSSKGCLARKQVERSPSDPGILIITYTAEHSHGHPTRRNSLSGSTRNKKSSTPKISAYTNEPHTQTDHQTVLSPSTPSITHSIENDLMQQESVKQEEDQIVGDTTEVNIFDMMLSDELFPSLDSLIGLTTEFSFDGCFLD